MFPVPLSFSTRHWSTTTDLLALRTDALNIPMVGGCLAQVITDTFEVAEQSQSTAARE